MLRSLFALMKLDNDVPVHTTLSRRKPKLGKVEPPRVSRRLHLLRGWSHDKTKQVFTGGKRARSADGLVLPPLSVGEITLKLCRALNYSQD